jgi:hypothetical protein
MSLAEAGANPTADSHQTNIAFFKQTATQITGAGGNGGNHNIALGGNIGVHGLIGSDLIASGGNGAGNGGDGHFTGAVVDTTTAMYSPVDAAVGASHAIASANQTNTVHFDQGTVQIAAVGGQGGNGNTAKGGDVSVFGLGEGSDQSTVGSAVIMTGANSSGNGGAGHFSGSIVDVSVAIYAPIDIAVAASNSTANADQSNNVNFNQAGSQMAGVGGQGGNGNVTMGGDVSVFGLGKGSDHGPVGSNVIVTGANSAGNGGDGHFSGSMIDVSVAIYAPIDIAVAGPNSTANAHQSNNVDFNQTSFQTAGVGGQGGNGNAAIGGDVSVSGLGKGSGQGSIGSDVIMTGANSAGNGGDGSFFREPGR